MERKISTAGLFLYTLIQSYLQNNLSCGRIFHSNLAVTGEPPKGNARTNTAYSGSLDASDRANTLFINRTADLSISLRFGRELSLSLNRPVVRTIYFSNDRTFDMSNNRTFESYLLPFSRIWNEPAPLLITAILIFFIVSIFGFPCFPSVSLLFTIPFFYAVMSLPLHTTITATGCI